MTLKRRFAALPIAATVAGITMSAALPALAYDVQEIGSLYIGGESVKVEGMPARAMVSAPGLPVSKVDPNGDFHTGQMYVQFVKLANPQAKYPLLMWHTGGITGASWETKPDGKPGWMQFFLKRGHDVFVSDAVERGRATFQRFPEIYKGEPVYRDKKEGWEIFRIGPPGSYASEPSKRVAHAGQRFPLKAFDTLQMQMAARWTTTEKQIQAAYDALVQKACPCVIMAHGQAGNFAFRAALANPDKVKGIIAVEPAFAPKPDNPDIARLKGIPHLFVWGDYLDTNPVWVEHVRDLRMYYGALKSHDVKAEWFDLPAAGIKGNSHMLMMDQNSDEIAARVQSWISKSGLMNAERPRVATRTAVPLRPR